MSTFQAQRIQDIQALFEGNPQLFDYQHPDYQSIEPKGSSKIKATLPLKEHPDYGETVLYISEKLDSSGNIIEYHYGWEHSQRLRRLGKQLRHITAFGNEDHSKLPLCDINRFHHHHVPYEPKLRKPTNVMDIKTVIGILSDYIVGGSTYNETDSF